MQTNQILNDFLKRKVAFSISRGPWNRTSLREHDRVHGSCFTEGRIESPNPVKTALGPSAGRQITSVTLILASAGDLRFVPWPLPEHRYFPIEVVLLDSEHNIDIRAWASHCKRGVAIRWAPSEASDANEALDDILNRASGELIVALDTYRSQDITDVGDLLRGHENGASFMKDTMVSPELDSDCKRFHVNEASIALHYSSANGTPIRDFGLGSFALRRNVVSKVLAVRRPPRGKAHHSGERPSLHSRLPQASLGSQFMSHPSTALSGIHIRFHRRFSRNSGLLLFLPYDHSGGTLQRYRQIQCASFLIPRERSRCREHLQPRSFDLIILPHAVLALGYSHS